MPTIKINKLTSIESNPSNTLLETMEQAGLEPEYNCRDGHCGACRCTLDSGEVEYVGFAMAYTQANEILPCICMHALCPIVFVPHGNTPADRIR